ncbi:MAG: hypothetical protein OEY75_05915 [Hylemonella sp.]|nr:hypothetical protein [Hylemonella sp.]
MSMPEPALVEAVQTNCHIADAAHAADMSLCIYLLQMREFFRWELGLAPMESMAREEVGAWLSAREALWDSLEDSSWHPLPVQGVLVDPFDVEAVNAALAPVGLVYGAGHTAPGRAGFFLADLESAQQRDGVLLRISSREHARGLLTPPAALADNVIYLRRESLRRWLWEKYEAWTLRRPEGPFKAALDAYGHGSEGAAAVDRLAQAQAETLILHELGEARVSALFGEDWGRMREAMNCRKTDLLLRAVRDLLADSLSTLPALLASGEDASVHFWFANFEGMRTELAPALPRAYAAWCAGDGGASLRAEIARGASHWQRVGEQAMVLHHQHGSAAQPQVRQWLESPGCMLG